mgnify:CR=1 FL=1
MGSGGIDSARMEAGAGNWGVGDGFGVRFEAGLHWEPRYPSGSGAIREDFTGGIRSFHSGGVSVQDLVTKPLPCSQNCSTRNVAVDCNAPAARKITTLYLKKHSVFLAYKTQRLGDF